MRPRQQTGQVCKRGSNWVIRFHEDRITDGQVKRVRTLKALAPIAAYKTERDVRLGLAEKISAILRTVNTQNSDDESATVILGEFIERRYFPRLDFRLAVPSGNELHIEPSTVKGYRDIWKVHIEQSSIVKTRMREFTSRDGQRFLESLPQDLSHQTHLRIKNFLRGVLTWAIADGAFVGVNPMIATKAGGRSKKTDPKNLNERQRKIRASNEHAYTLEAVAEMLEICRTCTHGHCGRSVHGIDTKRIARAEVERLRRREYQRAAQNMERPYRRTEDRSTGSGSVRHWSA